MNDICVKVCCNFGLESVIENYSLSINSGTGVREAKKLVKDLNSENPNNIYTLVEITQ